MRLDGPAGLRGALSLFWCIAKGDYRMVSPCNSAEASMRLTTFVGFGAIVALAACKDSYGNGGGCSPNATQVCMVAKTFSPITRTVTHGTTVEWVNGDGYNHTVTNDPGSGETYNQTVGGGLTFSFT